MGGVTSSATNLPDDANDLRGFHFRQLLGRPLTWTVVSVFALAAGIAAAICGLGAGVFDIFENRAVLKLLDVPLRSTAPAMIQAIRSPAAAKWILASVTVVLLSASFIRRPKTHESSNRD